MSSRDLWIEEKSISTIYPEQVARTLRKLQEGWPETSTSLHDLLEAFPLGEVALLHLLAVSNICADRLMRNPEILFWLQQRDVCAAGRGPRRMLAHLHDFAGDAVAAENFRLLRLWKGREMTRIALREVAEVAPLEETTAELSLLAEICVAQVLEHWNTEMRNRRGSPETDFAVLGLGKLGGRELNHSSDIDVIFLYEKEGDITANLNYHEWFNSLGNKIIKTFSSSSSDGSLFRIDLRLRPEGTAGPLVRSLESMENYYAGFGETWERLALIKARGIAGSKELAYEFLREHQPFIYPKSPTPDLLEEISAIKRRIERDIVGHEDLDRNVKLGVGGIREIAARRNQVARSRLSLSPTGRTPLTNRRRAANAYGARNTRAASSACLESRFSEARTFSGSLAGTDAGCPRHFPSRDVPTFCRGTQDPGDGDFSK